MNYNIELSNKAQAEWQQKTYAELIPNSLALLFYEDYILKEINKNNYIQNEVTSKENNEDNFLPLISLEFLTQDMFNHSLKFYLGSINHQPVYGIILKESDFKTKNKIKTKAKTKHLSNNNKDKVGADENDTDTNIDIDSDTDTKIQMGFQSHKIQLNNQSLMMAPLKLFLSAESEQLITFLTRAKQLMNWHKTSLFCSSCGGKTTCSDTETAKICLDCGRVIYPHTSPAVLVLIEHEDKVLLARSPYFRPGHYSVLAGFVEAGESLEQTLLREVKEEVGISIKNIRYFGSQPWPFENSFMVAFRAEYEAGDIKICPIELEDAQWFHFNDLPELPYKSSLSRKLIDSYIEERKETVTTSKSR